MIDRELDFALSNVPLVNQSLQFLISVSLVFSEENNSTERSKIPIARDTKYLIALGHCVHYVCTNDVFVLVLLVLSYAFTMLVSDCWSYLAVKDLHST